MRSAFSHLAAALGHGPKAAKKFQSWIYLNCLPSAHLVLHREEEPCEVG